MSAHAKKCIKRVTYSKGQSLITLLFFAVIAITITSAAVAIMIVNSVSGEKLQDSTVAYEVAESGADNAILRLLRDPNYSGETLSVGSGSATISLSSSGGVTTITSKGTVGNFVKTIQVNASYVNNILVATPAGETY